MNFHNRIGAKDNFTYTTFKKTFLNMLQKYQISGEAQLLLLYEFFTGCSV